MTRSREPKLPSYIKVKKSARARRMALRLDAKERVFHLVLPKGMSVRSATAFIEEHERWMKEKLRELPRPVSFNHGESIPVFGRHRTIRVIKRKTLKTTDVILKQNEILVVTNLDDPTQKVKRALAKWAKLRLTELAEEKAAEINEKVKEIHVRDTKSRWGSCADDGGLSFSWRLIFAPEVALDYVVAHEVAHLRHMNHGRHFWNLCRAISDDFLEGQYWMQNFGQDLMRYGYTDATE
ncbi:MAG TPA: SprT family zinc-dependent metalloprotease [Alphaproteobacteria bacterium]|nr:M48 family metallopeptidase [Micavibrio sp.]HQX27763.1 SprT family zinc-dependent metalloprotease [Alphaproteobacteria bacterium]